MLAPQRQDGIPTQQQPPSDKINQLTPTATATKDADWSDLIHHQHDTSNHHLPPSFVSSPSPSLLQSPLPSSNQSTCTGTPASTHHKHLHPVSRSSLSSFSTISDGRFSSRWSAGIYSGPAGSNEEEAVVDSSHAASSSSLLSSPKFIPPDSLDLPSDWNSSSENQYQQNDESEQDDTLQASSPLERHNRSRTSSYTRSGPGGRSLSRKQVANINHGQRTRSASETTSTGIGMSPSARPSYRHHRYASSISWLDSIIMAREEQQQQQQQHPYSISTQPESPGDHIADEHLTSAGRHAGLEEMSVLNTNRPDRRIDPAGRDAGLEEVSADTTQEVDDLAHAPNNDSTASLGLGLTLTPTTATATAATPPPPPPNAHTPGLAAPSPLRQGDLEMLQALHLHADHSWDGGEHPSRNFWSSRRGSFSAAVRRTSAEISAGAAKAAGVIISGVSTPKRKSSKDSRQQTNEVIDLKASLSEEDTNVSMATGSHQLATSADRLQRQISTDSLENPSGTNRLQRQISTDSFEMPSGTTAVTVHSTFSPPPSSSTPPPSESRPLPGLSSSPSPLAPLRPRGFSHSHLSKMHLSSPSPSIPEETTHQVLSSSSSSSSELKSRPRSSSTLRSRRTSSKDSLRSAAIVLSHHSRSQSQLSSDELSIPGGLERIPSRSSLYRKTQSLSSLRETALELEAEGKDKQRMVGSPIIETDMDETVTVQQTDVHDDTLVETGMDEKVSVQQQPDVHDDTTVEDLTSNQTHPMSLAADQKDSSEAIHAPLSFPVWSSSPTRPSVSARAVHVTSPSMASSASTSQSHAQRASFSPSHVQSTSPSSKSTLLSAVRRKEAPPPLALPSLSSRATSAYRSLAKKSSSALASAFFGSQAAASKSVQPASAQDATATPRNAKKGSEHRPVSPIKLVFREGKNSNHSSVRSHIAKVVPAAVVPSVMNEASGGAGPNDYSPAFGGGGQGGTSGQGSGTPGGGGGGGPTRRPNRNTNGGAGPGGGGGGGRRPPGAGMGGHSSGSSSSESVSTMFKRLELVGRGAYGAVYRGVHQASGNIVALKVVNLDTPDDDVSDIQREVALLSQLREAEQKNVVRYWGCWLRGPELWIVMDFAEAGSVRTLMRGGAIVEQHAVVIVRETLIALAYLHKAGIIHRDIKAANILLTNAGRILLCDFGVAASLVSSVSKRTTFVGTPYWMAPEVITTGKTYDQSADIWSLGITIYEMVTGNPPLADQEQMRAIMLIPKNKPPRLPTEGNFSYHMREFVATCLNEEAKERPGAEELSKSKWIKSSAKVGTSILKDLIATYTAWTKAGGMRMSLLGAEAADLDANASRDSFIYDTGDASDGWEFDEDANGRGYYQSFDGEPQSSSQQMGPSTSSYANQAQQKDHPLLRLFRPEGMETMEDVAAPPATFSASQQTVPTNPTSGLLAQLNSQNVRPAPPPPIAAQHPTNSNGVPTTQTTRGLNESSGATDTPSTAISSSSQLQPTTPTMPDKPSFTGTGASPFRFGAPVASSAAKPPTTASLPTTPDSRSGVVANENAVAAQQSPSKRWALRRAENQNRSRGHSSQGSVEPAVPQSGEVGDGTGGRASGEDSSGGGSLGGGTGGDSKVSLSESPSSSSGGNMPRSMAAGGLPPVPVGTSGSTANSGRLRQYRHQRGQSSVSGGSLYSKDTSADHSPVMVQNGHLFGSSAVPDMGMGHLGGQPPRPWTSGAGTSGRSRNSSIGSQGSGSGMSGVANNVTGQYPVASSGLDGGGSVVNGVFQPTQPSLLGPRNRSGSRSRAGPGGDVGHSHSSMSPHPLPQPTRSAREQLTRLQMPTTTNGTTASGLLPPSPSSVTRTGIRPSPLNQLFHHQRRQHGGSDPTIPVQTSSALLEMDEGSEQVHVQDGIGTQVDIEPLNLVGLSNKEAVHEQLAKTVDELGAWLDTLAFSLAR
ncbi:unnamed protein product [Sympodiomycopsis kandeliae]